MHQLTSQRQRRRRRTTSTLFSSSLSSPLLCIFLLLLSLHAVPSKSAASSADDRDDSNGLDDVSFVDGGTAPACWLLSDTSNLQIMGNQLVSGFKKTLLHNCPENARLTIEVDEDVVERIDVPVGYKVEPGSEFRVRISAAGWPHNLMADDQQHHHHHQQEDDVQAALVLRLCSVGLCVPESPFILRQISEMIPPQFPMNGNASENKGDSGNASENNNGFARDLSSASEDNVVYSDLVTMYNISDLHNRTSLEDVELTVGSGVSTGTYSILAYLAILDNNHTRVTAIANIPEKSENQVVTFVEASDGPIEVTKKATNFVIVLSGIAGGCILCLFLCVAYNINAQVFQLTQGKFLLAMMLCGMISTSCLVFLEPRSDLYCQLQQPMIILPLYIMYAIVLARMWRIRAVISPLLLLTLEKKEHWTTKIVTTISWITRNRFSSDDDDDEDGRKGCCGRLGRNTEKGQEAPRKKKKIRRTITDTQLAKVIAMLVLPQLVLQILMLTLYKNEARVKNDDEDFPDGVWVCEYSFFNAPMHFTACIMVCLLFVMIVILARASKELPSLFNETQTILDIAWTSLAIVGTGILLIVATRSEDSASSIRFLVSATAIGMTTVYTCFKIAMPKLIVAWSGQQVLVTKLIADHNFQRTNNKKSGSNVNNNPGSTGYYNSTTVDPSRVSGLSGVSGLGRSHYSSNTQYTGPYNNNNNNNNNNNTAKPETSTGDSRFSTNELRDTVDMDEEDLEEDLAPVVEGEEDLEEDQDSMVVPDIEKMDTLQEETDEDTEADDLDDSGSDDNSTDSSVILEVMPNQNSIVSSIRQSDNSAGMSSEHSRTPWNTLKLALKLGAMGGRPSQDFGPQPRPPDLSASEQDPSIPMPAPVGRVTSNTLSEETPSSPFPPSSSSNTRRRRTPTALPSLVRNTMLHANGSRSTRRLVGGGGELRNSGGVRNSGPSIRSSGTPNRNISTESGHHRSSVASGGLSPGPARVSLLAGVGARISMLGGRNSVYRPSGGSSGGRGSSHAGQEPQATITYNPKLSKKSKKILVSETEPPGRRLLLRMIDVQRMLLKVNDAVLTGLVVDKEDWESLRESCMDLGTAFKNEVVFEWETQAADAGDDKVHYHGGGGGGGGGGDHRHDGDGHGGGGGGGARRKKRPPPASRISWNPSLDPEHLRKSHQKKTAAKSRTSSDESRNNRGSSSIHTASLIKVDPSKRGGKPPRTGDNVKSSISSNAGGVHSDPVKRSIASNTDKRQIPRTATSTTSGTTVPNRPSPKKVEKEDKPSSPTSSRSNNTRRTFSDDSLLRRQGSTGISPLSSVRKTSTEGGELPEIRENEKGRSDSLGGTMISIPHGGIGGHRSEEDSELLSMGSLGDSARSTSDHVPNRGVRTLAPVCPINGGDDEIRSQLSGVHNSPRPQPQHPP